MRLLGQERPLTKKKAKWEAAQVAALQERDSIIAQIMLHPLTKSQIKRRRRKAAARETASSVK